MKRFLTVMALAFFILSPTARADGPDDQYVSIYNLIQQGDTFKDKGESAAAMSKYAEAQTELKRFGANYPDWNVKVVKYRLKYLGEKITELSSQPPPSAVTNAPASAMTNAPTPAPSSANPAPAPTTTESAPVQPTPPPALDAETKIKNLEDQIRAVEADKALLQAKLKEALSAQPASADPQELANAQTKIKELEKRNDLLQTTLEQAKTNVPGVIPVDDGKVKASLEEANRKVFQLNDENAKLALANDALQAQVKKTMAPDANSSALREENEVLKKQLAELQSKGATTSPADDLDRNLKESQAQIATLQSDKEMLRLQNIALDGQVKKMMAAAPSAPVVAAPMPDGVMADKIARLEAERDALQKTVNAVTKDLHGKKKGKAMADHIEEMAREVASLQSRMGILESSSVPYTPEELALFSPPPTTLMAAAVRSNVRKSMHDLPAKASVVLDEARRYFVAGDLEKAKAKYEEVLKLDQKNVAVLADLAGIELELGRTDEAENHIQTALGMEPNDDYCLYVLGQVKFREKKYDEAFAALSQAAQINPQNAKVQNFLGLTLSEKGMVGPAEAAFRKAIQFDPGFAQAHLNLAVAYITRRPPLVELAKWHYQKALAAGQPPKPDLEKLLDAQH